MKAERTEAMRRLAGLTEASDVPVKKLEAIAKLYLHFDSLKMHDDNFLEVSAGDVLDALTEAYRLGQKSK